MKDQEVINPENKCAHLYAEHDIENPLQTMFDLQLSLQRDLFKRGKSIDYDSNDFQEKVGNLSTQWRNMTLEFAEMLERLPFKEWKTYTKEDLNKCLSEEEMMETKYELIDMFHFFLNMALSLDIKTEKEFTNLYISKNQENFDRQNRGY